MIFPPHCDSLGPRNGNPPSLLNRTTLGTAYSLPQRRIISPPDHAWLLPSRLCYLLVSDALCTMQSKVLSRESISSVYAVVIPVHPLFASSSITQSTGIHSDTVIGTALRRACGASCIRLKVENTYRYSIIYL